jgi:hypothetical protein
MILFDITKGKKCPVLEGKFKVSLALAEQKVGSPQRRGRASGVEFSGAPLSSNIDMSCKQTQ